MLRAYFGSSRERGPSRKLYQSYALGKIPETCYELLSAEYEKEQAEHEQSLQAHEADSAYVERFMELAQRHTDFSELTPVIVNEFMEKIIVHAPDKSRGERVQEVKIYLNFIGRFDAPMSERMEKERKARTQATLCADSRISEDGHNLFANRIPMLFRKN